MSMGIPAIFMKLGQSGIMLLILRKEFGIYNMSIKSGKALISAGMVLKVGFIWAMSRGWNLIQLEEEP
jgi:hypothetical protein